MELSGGNLTEGMLHFKLDEISMKGGGGIYFIKCEPDLPALFEKNNKKLKKLKKFLVESKEQY